MRSDQDRLLDILEAIERIRRHTHAGRATFDADELVQTWVVHHLQIIGEAASRLSTEVMEAMPDVPWRGIVGMRNVLVHGYFVVDPDAVWAVVEHDLEPLESAISDHVETRSRPSQAPDPQAPQDDPTTRFHHDMVTGVETLKREIAYHPSRFTQMLSEYGGVDAAKRILASKDYSEGFTTLWEHGRLDLSVEAFVLLPWYRDLFTPTELATAERRLGDYGFDVGAFLRRAASQPPDWTT